MLARVADFGFRLMYTERNMITTKIVIGTIIFMALVGCGKREDNYFYKKARDDFIKYTIPDIKENWDEYIPYAFQLKKNEDRIDKALGEESLQKYDPNSLKALKRFLEPELSKQEKKLIEKIGLPPPAKWEFWADILKAPNKHIATTTKGDVFLEYRVETFDSDDSFGMYSFAIVEMMFAKDDRPG